MLYFQRVHGSTGPMKWQQNLATSQTHICVHHQIRIAVIVLIFSQNTEEILLRVLYFRSIRSILGKKKIREKGKISFESMPCSVEILTLCEGKRIKARHLKHVSPQTHPMSAAISRKRRCCPTKITSNMRAQADMIELTS